MLGYGFTSRTGAMARRSGSSCRIFDRAADDRHDRRDRRSTPDADEGDGRGGRFGDRIDSQGERGRERVLSGKLTETFELRLPRRRKTARKPDRRARDERQQSGHPGSCIQRLMQRSSGALGTSPSTRRTAQVRLKYLIAGVPQPVIAPIARQFHSSDHPAHQGDGRALDIGETSACGGRRFGLRLLPQGDRFPRIDDAERARRRRRRPHLWVDHHAVRRWSAWALSGSRRRAVARAQVRHRAVRDGTASPAHPQRQGHDSARRAV